MLKTLERLVVKNVLGREALTQYESGAISNDFLKKHIKEILRLSDAYNFPEQKNISILSSKESIHAYMLYFLLINYYKVSELLKKIDLKIDKNYKILDFGCGPGSAALAIAENLKSKAEIFLYDVAENSAKEARKTISEFCPQAKSEIIDKSWKTQKFDIILVANSINEIPENKKQDCVRDLVSSLSDQAVLIILEPALKFKTRQVMKIRDQILSTNKNLSVIFPCTHNNACPMLLESEEDWCHTFLNWEGSKLVRQIDQLTGFNKHRLKYSSFIFSNYLKPEKGFRIVNNPIKDKTGLSLKICGNNFYQLVKFSKKKDASKYKAFKKHKLFDFIRER